MKTRGNTKYDPELKRYIRESKKTVQELSLETGIQERYIRDIRCNARKHISGENYIFQCLKCEGWFNQDKRSSTRRRYCTDCKPEQT